MYTKVQFGKDLKELLTKTKKPHVIGRWAFKKYWEHLSDLEDGVDDIAITLNTMEDGPEFAFTYDELQQIADDLIAGKPLDPINPLGK